MKIKRITSVLLASIMALSVVACGSTSSSTATGSSGSETTASSASTSTATDTAAATGVKGANEDPANTQTTDETITIGLSAEPSDLWGSGSGTTQNESAIIDGALFDTLVTKDQTTGEIKPNLATEWSWTDDTHLQFKLRDDVMMTDGTPLTVDDVVYSVGVWKEKSASSDSGRFLVGATKDDDSHVTIEFNTVAPALLDMLAWTNFGIVSEDEVNAAGGIEAAAKSPIMGSGKYKFKEWKSGQSITLERNDNYWNSDYKGYYKEIVFTFTSDAASREMSVESGDSDVAIDMPVSQAATYTNNENVSVISYTFNQISHLWYNMTDSHKTSDIKVRQAIDKALDFDAIAQVGTAGFGQPSLGYFDESSPLYNQTYTTEERVVDVDGAKKLLEEAGIATDGSVELTALGLQDTTALYTVMQENLRAIGITLKINTVDTATFVDGAFGGDYDLIIVGEYIGERNPTMICFLQQANIDSGYVIGGPKVTTTEIDSDITKLIQETDETKAKEEAGALEQTMKDQCIVSNLYPEMKSVIVGKDIKGYTTRERGFMDPTSFYKNN